MCSSHIPSSGCSIGIKYLAFICRRFVSSPRLLIYQSFVYITTNSWVFSTLDYNEHYFISFTQMGPQGLFHLVSGIPVGYYHCQERWEKGSSSKWDKPKTQQLTSDFQISTASVQPTCCPKDWLRSIGALPESRADQHKLWESLCVCVFSTVWKFIAQERIITYLNRETKQNKKPIWTALGHNEAVRGSINSASLVLNRLWSKLKLASVLCMNFAPPQPWDSRSYQEHHLSNGPRSEDTYTSPAHKGWAFSGPVSSLQSCSGTPQESPHRLLIPGTVPSNTMIAQILLTYPARNNLEK